MSNLSDIIMPQLGESIAEATIVEQCVKPGDPVKEDQVLFEVETDKATLTVTAPCSGVVEELTAEVGTTHAVGASLGSIRTSGETAALEKAPSQEAGEENRPARPKPEPPRVTPTLQSLPVPAKASGASYLSPRMKARMEELGLHAADMAGIAGSGAGGRVTIDDLERFLAKIEDLEKTKASPMRVAVADAMRRSWTRPLASVGRSVQVDALFKHRRTLDPKPGPTLYAIRSLGLALAEMPSLAGRLIGTTIVHAPSIDIGFAVEAEDGVLVPLIREVEKLTLGELTERYIELVQKARDRQLPQDATGLGAATVTNFGGFGLEWATPIPLPEQTLVLGLGTSRKVPFWSEEAQQFVPVSEAALTLSFDHRVLDGGAAGRLLSRVAELMMSPEQL